VFTWLTNAFNWARSRIDNTVAAWVHDVVTGLYGFIHLVFGDIINGWNDLVGDAKGLLNGIYEIGEAVIREVTHLWKIWIPNLWSWIGTHITKPLIDAWNWIGNEGATVWHYISNPDDLAAYLYSHLIKRLETLAWETTKDLGEFAVSLIINNLTQLLTVIEDIIDAVF